MSRKRYRAVKFTSFLELTNDVDELLELFSQSESLNKQAENELLLRKTERDLIRRKLKKLRFNATELRITDHAVVRYLERVVGVDIEACRKEMLSKLPEGLQASDEVEFVNISTNGLQYVIRDNLIISVTPTEATDSQGATPPHRTNHGPKSKLVQGQLKSKGEE